MHFAGFIQVEESVQQPEKYFEISKKLVTLFLKIDEGTI
mgnify:CR=1 FL=1